MLCCVCVMYGGLCIHVVSVHVCVGVLTHVVLCLFTMVVFDTCCVVFVCV